VKASLTAYPIDSPDHTHRATLSASIRAVHFSMKDDPRLFSLLLLFCFVLFLEIFCRLTEEKRNEITRFFFSVSFLVGSLSNQTILLMCAFDIQEVRRLKSDAEAKSRLTALEATCHLQQSVKKNKMRLLS
jgi:hypothetical protein